MICSISTYGQLPTTNWHNRPTTSTNIFDLYSVYCDELNELFDLLEFKNKKPNNGFSYKDSDFELNNARKDYETQLKWFGKLLSNKTNVLLMCFHADLLFHLKIFKGDCKVIY